MFVGRAVPARARRALRGRARPVPVLAALAARASACALALAGLCVLAAPPPGAEAAKFMVSIMQDDNQLIHGTGLQREAALTRMQSLGVDAVRVTVLWDLVAPRRRPRNGASPRSYRASRWDRYDSLVRSAADRGIHVYFNVTAPGPRWAHARSRDPSNRRTWKPSAREFGRFMEAVAIRYSGTYRDESTGGMLLPRVWWWSLFNEPNQGGWLTPQARRSRRAGGVIPTSPALYRRLVAAGVRALIRTGHADDLVLIGETAPLGGRPRSERRPLRPALFLRELFCLDRRLRPFRGAQARARGCGSVGTLRVLSRLPRLAYGHHPYTKRLTPYRRDRSRDSISIANIRALPALLDRIARRTGLLPPGTPIFLTEFGYETNPPDPFNGVAPEKQAAYLNQGDYIAYRNPRVFATTQFQLLDVPPRTEFPRGSKGYWFTFQSGLFTDRGKPKPAAGAYAMPFEVRRAPGGRYLLWGQVRFTPNGSRQTVQPQFRPKGATAWQSAGPAVAIVSHVGFWEAIRELPRGATLRAEWVAPDRSASLVTREIALP